MTRIATHPVIELQDAAGEVRRVTVTGDRVLIGRLDTADVSLPSAGVSRAHAELIREPDGRWRLRDLDSHNGTWVGGARIKECRVTFGNEFTIGEYALRLLPGGETPAFREPVRYAATISSTERFTSLHDSAPPHVRADHLARVAQEGERLLSIADRDERLARVCRLMLQDPLPGRAAMVLRLAGGAAPQVVSPAQQRSERDQPPHVSRTLLDAVFERRQALMASDSAMNGDAIEMSVAVNRASMAAAACPLTETAPGEPMDVLYVTMPQGYDGTEWLALIVLAVEQLRHVEVAWRHRQEAERMAALERELEQARKLQMSFVPRIQPGLGMDVAICFEPCLAVGGDYVDVLQREGDRLLLTVADVCGKGIRAAMTTASLHTMVRSGCKAGLELPQIMDSINEYLIDTLATGQFVTMIAMEVNIATGALACVNCGHPPAVVADGRGNHRWLEMARHFPLGVLTQEMQVVEDRLNAGETIALFSDGFSELPVAERQLWGVEGVADAVRAAVAAAQPSTAAAVVAAIHAHSDELLAGRTAPDDRTLLLARRV